MTYFPSGNIVIFEIRPPFFNCLIYLSSATLSLHMCEGKRTEASDSLFLGDAAITKRIMKTNDNSGLYPISSAFHRVAELTLTSIIIGITVWTSILAPYSPGRFPFLPR